MKTFLGWTLIIAAIAYGLSGCSVNSKDLRVLTSQSPVVQKHFQVDSNTTLICDPRGCREAD